MNKRILKENIKMYQAGIDERKNDIKKLEEKITKIKQQIEFEEKIKERLEKTLKAL